MQFLFSHPAPFQGFLCLLQLNLQKSIAFTILLSGLLDHSLGEIGFMGDHESNLGLHHSNYLIDAVQLVLASNVFSVEEVSPPDVAKEVIADQFLFESFSHSFIRVWSEKFFPILSGLDLSEHRFV